MLDDINMFLDDFFPFSNNGEMAWNYPIYAVFSVQKRPLKRDLPARYRL